MMILIALIIIVLFAYFPRIALVIFILPFIYTFAKIIQYRTWVH